MARPAELHDPFPLTEIQQAQWLGRLGAFEGGNVAAHVYWEVEGADVDLDRLQTAWDRVFDRHPMLRAVVTPDGTQRILPDTGPYRIDVLDLRYAPAPEVAAALARLRERLSHEMRPPERWPLFEIRAVRLPGGLTRLHLSFDLLISDIGSIRLLLRDWRHWYVDPAAEAPAPRISFRDYVQALSGIRGTGAYQRALDYWRRRIELLPPRPDLPLAVAPASLTRPEFVARDLRVESATWERIRRLAAVRGVTPSALLLAAYAAVLGRWCRTGRFTLNVTVINRLPVHEDVADLVGEFASFDLLPVDLVELRGRPEELVELARRLQRQSWDDLEHRYVNGVEVLREMARARGDAAGAVMPIVFTSTLVQAAEPGDESMFGWLGDVVHEIAQTPQVWIDFALLEVAGGVQMSWHAVRQLFPAGVLDDMFDAFGGLVLGLADEAAWAAPVPELLPGWQRELVAAANDTAGPLPGGLLFGPLLERATAAPDRPAVIAADRTLTYGELVRHGARLGRQLRRAGVRPNELVAVAVPKSAEQVVAALGVLLSGGAYLPVDPDLPTERQHWLVEHGRARYVLVPGGGPADPDRRWPDGVRPVPVELTGADGAPGPGDADGRPGAEGADPDDGSVSEPVADPGDLAYVIFTSGSTGTPKGVMLSHRAALNTVDDIDRRYGVGPEDRVLGLSSLSFDLSVWDVFGVLGAGGALVLPPPGSGRDPARWRELMRRHGVTVWNSVPALMQMLVEDTTAATLGGPAGAEPAADAVAALAALRVVMMSGDWIPVDLPDRLRALAPAARIVSLGGATEAAVWSIAHEIGEVDPTWDSIPYGRPLRNQSFHVLNDRFEECPVWATGELYIGGAGLAEGYWRDEQRTAASFVAHPGTGERLYRTGDLGRWRPDGTVEFLGREDFQVKIGGFRIELGEIEAALNEQGGVATAVVAAVGPDRHHRRLVAYLVPEPGAGADADGLVERVRAAAGQTLPAYMLPAAFVVLDRLPLTANGKVDRSALPAPGARTGGAEELAAAGATAAGLAELVAGVLGVETVGLDDNFFAVGGDSILGIQVVSRAVAAGFDLSPADLFQHRTIREMTAVVTARSRDAGGSGDRLPLTPAQRAALAAGPLPAGYAELDLDPDGDPAAVAAAAGSALRGLLARHPALRLRLVGDEADQSQTVAPVNPDDGYVPLIDLSALPADRRTAAVAHMVAEMRSELDPVAGPLVKAALFELGDTRRLGLLASVLAADAWSWPVLLADVRAALDAGAADAGAAEAEPGDAEVEERPAAAELGDPFARIAARIGAPAAAGPDPVAGADAPGGPGGGAGAHPHGGTNRAAGRITAAVDAELTAELTGAAAEAYRLTGAEVAAAVLAEALRSAGAGARVLVRVERDLRDPDRDGAGADRAVGPFAGRSTARLDLPAEAGALLAAVKDAVRATGPDAGAGPDLVWRHLGRPDGSGDGVPVPAGWGVPGASPVVTSAVVDGRLLLAFDDPGDSGEAVVAAVPDAARRLLEHCRAPHSGAVSPSDFPLAGLDEGELAVFVASLAGEARELSVEQSTEEAR